MDVNNMNYLKQEKRFFTVRNVLRAIATFLIIFVFCPAFLVSCEGRDVNVSVMTAVGGVSVHGEKVVDAHPVMLIAVVLPILILALLFMKKMAEKKTSIIMLSSSVVDFIIWIAFRNCVKKFAEENYCNYKATIIFGCNMLFLIFIIVMTIMVIIRKIQLNTDLVALFSSRDTQAALHQMSYAVNQMTSAVNQMTGSVVNNLNERNSQVMIIGYCSKCGSGIQDDCKFCTKCGNPVPESMRLDAEVRKKAEEQRRAEEARLKAEEEARKQAEAEALRQAEGTVGQIVEKATIIDNDEKPVQMMNVANKQITYIFCQQCGSGIQDGCKFCIKCGNPVPENMRLDAEVRKKAEEQRQVEEARRQAEAEALRQAEEARKQAEAEALRRAEEARKQAEAEALRRAEETRIKAEEEARKQAEAEALRRAEEARKQAEVEALRQAEETRLKYEENVGQIVEKVTIIDNDEKPVQMVSVANNQMTYIFCQQCGTKLRADSVFCIACGTKLAK